MQEALLSYAQLTAISTAPAENPAFTAAGLVLMLSVVGLLHLRHAGPEGGMFPKIAAKGALMAS